jgi:hypothetical protein
MITLLPPIRILLVALFGVLIMTDSVGVLVPQISAVQLGITKSPSMLYIPA